MTATRRGLMSAAVFWVRASAGSLGFGIALLWYVLTLLLPMTNAARRQSFTRLMCLLCLRPAGIRLRVVGREHLIEDRPCVYACNHQSQLDYPIMGSVYPGNCLVMASQIGDWPVMGPIFRSSGCIEVDKHSPRRAVAALDEAERAVNERGNSIWIYVEGTRGKVRGEMGKFRRGAFRLATRTGVPVVPVVISPLKPETDLRGRRLDAHEVTLTLLPAVSPEGRDERELMTVVRARMEEALARHR